MTAVAAKMTAENTDVAAGCLAILPVLQERVFTQSQPHEKLCGWQIQKWLFSMSELAHVSQWSRSVDSTCLQAGFWWHFAIQFPK